MHDYLMIVGSFPPVGYSVFGGISASCKALIEAGIGERIELVLVDSTARSIPGPSFPIRAIDAIPRSIKFFSSLLLRRPRYVLIFASAGFSFLEKALYAWVACAAGAKVMFSPRGGVVVDQIRRNKFFRNYAKILLRTTDFFLCQGASWSSFLVQDLNIPAQRCHVIPNWTASRELLRIGRDRKYGSHSASRIVFLGWLDQTKGILELLRVFSALLTDHPRAQLLIAGEGDCSQAVRDFVYDNDLQGSIRLLGWVRDEQKINLLREGTIFCLPSYFEGMPNAMIEAMAAGLPIIVTAVGAIPSVIDDGINGLIIPVHDENSLRETLRKLMEDQALQEQLGTAAHQFARDNFGAEMAVKRIRKLFEY